jgi:hypothetical protein
VIATAVDRLHNIRERLHELGDWSGPDRISKIALKRNDRTQ